jgi:filamentous hemagglutinin family protein
MADANATPLIAGAHKRVEKIIMNNINHVVDRPSRNSFVCSSLSVCLALLFATYAQAGPVGGEVAAGEASISTAPNTTTVVQSTSKAIINWQSFSVGATESVNFVQPSASAIMLNRIAGSNASNIQGSISANGRVFLVNPNGILFAPNSQVSVGGMVATTLEVTDANFMAEKFQFSGDSTARVVNQGTISTQTDGGYVALIGAQVSNDGLITARLGTVALAAGTAVTLDVAGDNLLNISVDQGAVDALVENGNMIKADGGQVLMTARGAGTLLSNAVNNTGVVQAQTIQSQNGVIHLTAGPEAGTVNASGTIDASGLAHGQTGGTVKIIGKTVNLASAKVNVSGDSGGGLVVVGGNFKGAGPESNSTQTNIDSQSTLSADATRVGDGGRISVWSDSITVLAGTLSAKGGSHSGDGGFVETSGAKLILAETATVNTLAPQGKTGTWLLDPFDWTIATAGGDETPA